MSGNPVAITAGFVVWAAVILALFRLVGKRQATVVAVIGSYLLLPGPKFTGPGWFRSVEIGREAATGAALLAAMLVWDRAALLRFRPKLWDAPFLAYVLMSAGIAVGGLAYPFPGVRTLAWERVWWLVFYVAGRLYFGNLDGARRLLVGVVVGSLLYTPLVLFEAVMGPSWYLNGLVYGVPYMEGTVERLGGWRPVVFIGSGILVAAWLAIAAAAAAWLWLGKVWRPRWGPAWWPTLALTLTTLYCRGTYAYVDLAAGFAAVAATFALRTRVALVALALIAPAYVTLRFTGVWDGRDLVRAAAPSGREGTVRIRLVAEDVAVREVVRHNGAFGFGWPLGFVGRAEPTEKPLGADGGWLLYVWGGGMVGLALQFAALHLVPAGLALSRPSRRPDRSQLGSPAWGLALWTLLTLVDSLHNFPRPDLVALSAGALVGLHLAGRKAAVWAPAEDAKTRRDRDDGPDRLEAADESAVAVLAALACVLYVFGHARVDGFEGVKLAGGLGAALLFAAAGWVGAWAGGRFPIGRVAAGAAAFAALGVSFNLALHPSERPVWSADILQGLALCGLAVAAWRRAAGTSAWSWAVLAAAPVAAQVLLRPHAPAVPGLQYLIAAPGLPEELALFPVCPWLTLAALGAWARRESTAVNAAAAALFGAGAAFAWWSDPAAGAPLKFPMNLTYCLLACATAEAAVVAARLVADVARVGPGLAWLGRRWLLFFYLHFAVVAALARAPIRNAWAVWALVAAGGVAATWVADLGLARLSPWFRRPGPWLATGVVVLVAAAAKLPAAAVAALAGAAGLVFASQQPNLARVLGLDPDARPGSRRGGRTSGPSPSARRAPLPDFVRVAVVLAALAAPELVGAVTGAWPRYGTAPPPVDGPKFGPFRTPEPDPLLPPGFPENGGSGPSQEPDKPAAPGPEAGGRKASILPISRGNSTGLLS